jgi:hypothetical protein
VTVATYYVIRDTLGGYYTGVGFGKVQWGSRAFAQRFRTRQEVEHTLLLHQNEWLPCEVIEVRTEEATRG